MSEQLNQMQSMMEQLIKMVGNNNASIEELQHEIAEVKSNMTTKQELNEVKATIDEIKATMSTKEDIARLERLAHGTMDIVENAYHETEKISKKPNK